MSARNFDASALWGYYKGPFGVPSKRRRQLRFFGPLAAQKSKAKSSGTSQFCRNSADGGAQVFQSKAEVLYWPNFFSGEDFRRICQACRPLAKQARPEKNTLAKGRRGTYIPGGNEAVVAVLSTDVCMRIGRKLKMPPLFPGDFPVELRTYQQGSYMDWHVDEVMYREPQLEVILTLENTTDSETQWKSRSGAIISQWAEPNSLIVVPAGGPLHQVTRTHIGTRSILKFVLTPTLERNEVFEQNIKREAY